jgi:UvrD/REP helicase N-terminal domain/UvrD-like helicase C-terminal domain
MADFRPTEEQEFCSSEYATGDDLVISAYAGSGKTATLSLLSERDQDSKICFLAFNKKIAMAAGRKFPSNVDCRTAHSHAYRAVGRIYEPRLNGPKIYAKQHARFLGIKSGLEVGEDQVLSPYNLAVQVQQTVKNFCYSAEQEIDWMHVPFLVGANMSILRAFCVPLARKMWEDKQLKEGHCAFTHDDYFKLWSLSKPRLPFDVVMVDEAQDSNPALISVVMEQRQAQKVLVGDANQQIYAWRGAVDAMTIFPAKRRAVLSKSFRFGERIADEANKWLALLDNTLPLKGFEVIDSKLEHLDVPNAVLCRTNAQAVATALDCGIQGQRYAIVGGTQGIRRFAESAGALMNNDSFGVRHPDLVAFKTWQQVREFVNEEGGELKPVVNMIDQYGVDTIVKVCDEAVDEERGAPDVTISTAHKAKGLEWDKVKIAGDFKEPVEPETGEAKPMSRSEMMLLYVSVTRAQLVLDCESVHWVNRLLGEKQEGTLNITPEEEKTTNA